MPQAKKAMKAAAPAPKAMKAMKKAKDALFSYRASLEKWVFLNYG